MQKRQFKTTRTLAGAQKVYRKWESYSEGDVVVGKFVGNHVDQYKKNCPIIEVYEASFKDNSGDSVVGKHLVMNACGMLTKAMDGVQLNELVQVEYTGTSTIEDGPFKGKEAHCMKVDLVEEDTGSDSVQL